MEETQMPSELKDFDPVTLGILWSRLVAIVDEVAATLQRVAFSDVVRESNDLACLLFDAKGNSLAQSRVSVPSFLGTLPFTMRHFLKKYPPNTLQPGDVIATNDPWLGTGHLYDMTMAMPIFRGKELVAFSANVVHLADIGGAWRSIDLHEVYEEGLRIPICKLYKKGEANEDIFRVILNNVRIPDQIAGDLRAQVAANEVGARKILEVMDEHNVPDLSVLTEAIQTRSETVMRRAITQVPDGDYGGEIIANGPDGSIVIKIKISVRESTIVVDYTGSSPQSDKAINSPYNYTYAYTAYPLKCVLDSQTPNNEGCFKPIDVLAPEGSILNPIPPAAVGNRQLVGTLCPAAVFAALSEIIPHRVQSDSGVPWLVALTGTSSSNNRFSTIFFLAGGQGARSGLDGLSCRSFPTNISNTPVEILENEMPFLVESKELITDSGGVGRYRGGCGQRVKLRSLSGSKLMISIPSTSVTREPKGLGRGRPARQGSITMDPYRQINFKGFRLAFDKNEEMTLDIPGGGGMGNPLKRDPDLVLGDVADGLVSVEQALSDYGVTVDATTMSIDYQQTLKARFPGNSSHNPED